MPFPLTQFEIDQLNATGEQLRKASQKTRLATGELMQMDWSRNARVCSTLIDALIDHMTNLDREAEHARKHADNVADSEWELRRSAVSA